MSAEKAATPVPSARDQFAPASSDGTCTENVWGPMCDEIDRLRAEVEQLRGSQRRYLSCQDNTDSPVSP